MKLYGRRTSSNVQAVLWGAAEMGVELTQIEWGGRHGGNDDPAFRALNPHGLVPALELGDGEGLFESAAILRYLSNVHGRDPFWPSDPEARAHVDMWAEWAKHTVGRHFILDVFWAHWRTPEADRDVPAIDAAIRTFEGFVDLMPQIGEGYLAGPDFTLADVWLGHVLYRYFTLDIVRQAPAALEAYYARIEPRPAFQAHVMIDYSELKASLTA